MSFLDHLEELRWHLIRSLASIAVFAITAFIGTKFIWQHIILAPSKADFWTYRMMCKIGGLTGSEFLCLDELPFIIQSRQMTGQFTMALMSSLVIGLICAFPYAFWELWRFIKPGLHITERKASRGAVFFVTFLFILGTLFGYFVIAPISIRFLSTYQVDPSIANEFDIISYVTIVATLVLVCALMFQLPVVVYFLTKAGLINPKMMKSYRKHAFVVMLVLSAVITPPDVISQVLVTLPLIMLYQISIYLSAAIIKKEQRLEKASES